MSNSTVTAQLTFTQPGETGSLDQRPALVVLWAPYEPSRVGEVLLLPSIPDVQGWLVGRGGPHDDGPWSRPCLIRQRPGRNQNTGFISANAISRRHLEIRDAGDDALFIENLGRAPLLLNGHRVRSATVRIGDVLELHGRMLFVYVRRPGELAVWPEMLSPSFHRFGETDNEGMVGESPAVWEVRRQIALMARTDDHILILGASGSGKELAARAIHRLSARSGKPLVSRNAATIPETLVDAELFGTARNYPNAGMPERPGLAGQADGGTLFLDELGELPLESQAHLLRLMMDGEYQRLGEATTRYVQLRLIGATNRDRRELKFDLAARFSWMLELPDLMHRREDIPLVLHALLRQEASRSPYLAQRYFEGGDPRGQPRLSPALITALVRHRYSTNIWELRQLLKRAIAEAGPEQFLGLSEGLRRTLEEAAEERPVEEPTIHGRSQRGSPALNLEEIFSAEDKKRLELFRQVGFNVQDYADHPNARVARSTANDHLLLVMFKALQASGFDTLQAARHVAGDRSEQVPGLRNRLEKHLEHLAIRLKTEGGVVVREKLKRSYRAEFIWVAPVLDALETDGLVPRNNA